MDKNNHKGNGRTRREALENFLEIGAIFAGGAAARELTAKKDGSRVFIENQFTGFDIMVPDGNLRFDGGKAVVRPIIRNKSSENKTVALYVATIRNGGGQIQQSDVIDDRRTTVKEVPAKGKKTAEVTVDSHNRILGEKPDVLVAGAPVRDQNDK